MKLLLDVFEGPLDLLLYLIKKNNLEISRISIAEVTEQYLEYLESIKSINIDVASEFLVMAAELAYIKSKTLLPKDDRQNVDDQENLEEADSLVVRLREYQKYKLASEGLFQRKLLHRDVFKRGSLSFSDAEHVEENEEESVEKREERYEVGSVDLLRAFSEVIKRIPKHERKHHVEVERISVTERIYEILDNLKKVDHILFTDLFPEHAKKVDHVVSFLAILEMGKLKLVHIFQTDVFGPIRIKRKIEEVKGEDVKDHMAEEVDSYH